MGNKSLLIVMTENIWLYAGLKALLPEMECINSGFSDSSLPESIKYADKLLVAIDSFILFRGEWSTFNDILSLRPDAIMFWLNQKITGKVFPAISHGDRVLNLNQNKYSLRNALMGLSRGKGDVARVMSVNLTLTERILLPLIISGVDVFQLSRITGKPVKSLYSHRQKILQKTGFRNISILSFVYKQNRGLPCIPGQCGIVSR